MSTLFLIGNGFDLNCGLETKYENVCDKYVKTESKSGIIKQFKKDINSDGLNWSDFEITMGQYAQRLQKATDFIQCFNDFQIFMCQYLQSQEQSFYNNIKDPRVHDSISAEMSKSIANFYSGVSKNIDSIMKRRDASNILEMKFVSFNYTSVFDTLLKNSYKNFFINSVIHIHGTLEDPALGVDNEKQLITNYSIDDKLRRSFIKPFFNKQYDANRVRQTLSCIEDADTICVFGMSLGLSDLTWRNTIIEWLEKSVNRHLFLYDYEQSLKKYTTISDRMNCEDDAKKTKLTEWGVENMDKIIDRLHIICGRSIFNVENAIKAKRESQQT